MCVWGRDLWLKVPFSGQKFPAKTPEVALQATVSFPSDPLQGTDPQDDPFCVQQNAYINVCT